MFSGVRHLTSPLFKTAMMKKWVVGSCGHLHNIRLVVVPSFLAIQSDDVHDLGNAEATSTVGPDHLSNDESMFYKLLICIQI